MWLGKSVTATTEGRAALLAVAFVKEIRGSGCHVLWPLEGTDKPYISPRLGLVVSCLFEREKLARPSDTGHYVVATRLFHHGWAKWDVVLGQRANLQGWLFMVEPPWGMVTAHRESCAINGRKHGGEGRFERIERWREREKREEEQWCKDKKNNRGCGTEGGGMEGVAVSGVEASSLSHSGIHWHAARRSHKSANQNYLWAV